MLGLGVSGLTEGAYIPGLTAGIFHLVSHALFKAALFLGAGSVIHAVESIYMFDMGGLKKHMPKTYWLMVIATLSLAGIPPLSGFWSKDSVFLASLIAGTPYATVLLGVGAISAAMTFAYSLRYIVKTFHGKESEFIHDLEEKGHHIHEAPSIMWGPIAVLVALVVIVGLFGLVGVLNPNLSPEIFIEQQMHHMLHDIMPHEVELHAPHPETSTKLVAVGTSAAMLLLGGVIGWVFYLGQKIDSWKFVTSNNILKNIHKFLWNRWYLNSVYYRFFVYGIIDAGKGLYHWIESRLFYNIAPYVSRFFLKFSDNFYHWIESRLFYNIAPFVSRFFLKFGDNFYRDFEETVMERGLNIGVPQTFTWLYNRIKKIQTGLLNYNIIYLGITIVFIFLFLLALTGGRL
jgi:NADH-quinone oxidoreductase subunit L